VPSAIGLPHRQPATDWPANPMGQT
jgi:hypothetical protein